MLEQLLAIIRNTFFESIRQPIVLVLLVIATVTLVLTPALCGFTMEDDQRMFVDLGLATVFVSGTLLASFIATNVLTREIENKTVLTVISKPVSRPLFVLGKFFGVAGALLVSTAYMSFVFMLIELHGVLQTVRDPYHMPVLVFGVGAGIIGVGSSIWANYFYGKVFASTVIVITTPLVALAYVLSLMFSHDFSTRPMSEAFKLEMWMAIAAMTMAIIVLTAVAVAVSTRLSQVLTICVTLGIFVMGMLSDHFVGTRIHDLESIWLQRASAQGLTITEEVSSSVTLVTGEVSQQTDVDIIEIATVPLSQMAEGSEALVYAAYWVPYSVLPNFQVLWLSDALTQYHVVPFQYLLRVVLYGLLYTVAALGLAVALFQRREVG